MKDDDEITEWTQPRNGVSAPGQCRAKHKPWWRWWFVEEDRCTHFQGHKKYGHDNPHQAQHENSFDRKWD
jgi:hypothetical protein